MPKQESNPPKARRWNPAIVVAALVLVISPLFFFGAWGSMSLNRWWENSWDPSNPVPQSLITPQIRDELNKVYQINVPHRTQIVAINFMGGKDYTLYTHYRIPVADWRAIESALPAQYQQVEPKDYFSVCQWLDITGWPPVNPSSVEVAYRQRDLSIRTIIQCYPVDGECSVYIYAGDVAFSQSIWSLDWGL